MPLISLDRVSLAYGHVALLDNADLQIDKGERVCLIGRNGEGKSTLMRVVSGEVLPDDGKVWRQSDVRIAMLQQEVPENINMTVFDVIASGLEQVGQLITDYHHTILQLESNHDDSAILDKLGHLQHQLDSCDGWSLEQRVQSVISKLDLPVDAMLSDLSGGYKRRVLLARALVNEPDLLLLDEPTNHLDIEGIQWLENFLKSYNGAILFITHDRTFLQNLATRILELDRGQLTSWPGNYQRYCELKEQRLDAEEAENKRFDKKLAKEETWIRQGIKARRTRNEGRVRALQSLRQEFSKRRTQQAKAKIAIDNQERSGRLVADITKISFSYEGKSLIHKFSTRIMRGDRIGIIGPNGVGKSTLIKLMLGELTPDSGTVKLGTNLQIAYFDQQRAQLDPEKSVIDNLNQGSHSITINGKTKHAIGYLQDFLFPPQRTQSPVKSLSGGERNRLLLARLFCNPANLLVMDEPTNDLDVETLELLEELLLNYDGTIILVSHDRTFLDNVVTSTLVFEADEHGEYVGKVNEYVGGYNDWIRQRQSAGDAIAASQSVTQATASKANKKSEQPSKNQPSEKLTFKEKQALKDLPRLIEKLEQEKDTIENNMAQAEFYQQEKDSIKQIMERLESINTKLDEAYENWEALESRDV